MPHATSLGAPLLWTAYLLLPAAGWGLFHGAPLGIFGAAALFTIWWIWIFRGPLPGGMAFVVLLLIKLVAGSLLLIERGLEANYFANAQWAPPSEKSTDYPGRPFTRIDRRLVFGAQGSPDLPLYFFNDSTRFNYFRPGDPDRHTLPFSVTWQGYIWSRAAEDRRTFYLRGPGVTAELWVDGAQIVRLAPQAAEAREWARWPAGMRRLIVRVSSESGARRFEAGVVSANGTQTPFAGSELVTKAFAPWRIIGDRIVRFISAAIDTLLIATLICCVGITLFNLRMRRVDPGLRRPNPQRRHALVALAWLSGLGGALLSARPAANHLILIGGGQDELTFEHYARDIVLHGPLLLLGQSLGEAQPFHHPPLYPYFLAVTHLLIGEDLSGVYLVQWLLGFAVVLMVWTITTTLFGESIGRVGLAVAAVFSAAKLIPLSGVLRSDNLFVPLLTGWVLVMIQVSAPGSTTRIGVRAGLLGGLATLARSTLFAGWVLALPLLAGARRRARENLQVIALMLAVGSGVVSLATLRNAIASHRLVPIDTSVPMNVDGEQAPPAGVSVNRRSDGNSAVVPVAQNAPGLSANDMAGRALYVLGFLGKLVPGAGTSPGLIVTWWAALIGFGALTWGSVPEGLRGPVRALPATLCLSQFIVAVMFSHVYAASVILPVYVLLLPYAALGTLRSIDFLVPADAEEEVLEK